MHELVKEVESKSWNQTKISPFVVLCTSHQHFACKEMVSEENFHLYFAICVCI